MVLTAICDRGIGGKYLLTNLFRNKKCYVDYKEVSHTKGKKDEFEGIEAYNEAGDFVIGNVVKSINPPHLQISLINFPKIDKKFLRVGQILPSIIKSK